MNVFWRHFLFRPILDLKVAMVARDVARLCATFCKFMRPCVAMLRDSNKIIVNNCKTSIHMTFFVLVPRPSATLRNFARLLSATLSATMRRSGPG
jgi:hypothetical protein